MVSILRGLRILLYELRKALQLIDLNNLEILVSEYFSRRETPQYTNTQY